MLNKINYLLNHGISHGMIRHLSDPELNDLYLNVWEIWETNICTGD